MTDQELFEVMERNAICILKLETENKRLRDLLSDCHSYAIDTGAKIGMIEAIAKVLWDGREDLAPPLDQGYVLAYAGCPPEWRVKPEDLLGAEREGGNADG